MEPENLKLDKYLLSLVDKTAPKICFVGTASGDAESYIERFYESFKTLDCEPSHLSLYKAPIGDLREYVMDKDIFYVGGGNTRNLITLWKEWELDKHLREAYVAGKVMAGISAGSICWFEQGVTDSVPGKLLNLECLGFLEGSNCPHYDGEVERRRAYHSLLKEGMKPGYACDDGVAAHFVDGRLIKFVSSRPNAKAYRVEFQGSVSEVPIDPEFLEDF